MSENWSAEAYERASERHALACEKVASLLLAYRRDMELAEAELEAAERDLRAQESQPGIPGWLTQGGPWTASDLAPVPLRLVEDDDQEAEDYDPGPECDDEGGMSEYRHMDPAEDGLR